METEFFDECGEYASDYPDVELRFRAVASEIYAAHTTADFALTQAFAQTATGEYLDMHAAMRSITRKTAAAAKGVLTFSVPQALETDVDIPKGTVCSVKGDPLLQFATDEAAVITAGSLSAQAAATALADGERFNAPAESITVMVNPPEYVSAVTNESAFAGGCDAETDEALRSRLVSSYGAVSNGVNAKSLEEQILTVEGITDARVAMDPLLNILTVWLRTQSGEYPETTVTNAISQKLGVLEICGVQYSFAMAQESGFSVYAAVRAQSGADKESLKAEVENAVKQACSAERIGETVDTASIAAAVYAVSGVASAEIAANPSYEGVVACGTGEYLVLEDLQVAVYE